MQQRKQNDSSSNSSEETKSSRLSICARFYVALRPAGCLDNFERHTRVQTSTTQNAHFSCILSSQSARQSFAIMLQTRNGALLALVALVALIEKSEFANYAANISAERILRRCTRLYEGDLWWQCAQQRSAVCSRRHRLRLFRWQAVGQTNKKICGCRP